MFVFASGGAEGDTVGVIVWVGVGEVNAAVPVNTAVSMRVGVTVGVAVTWLIAVTGVLFTGTAVLVTRAVLVARTVAVARRVGVRVGTIGSGVWVGEGDGVAVAVAVCVGVGAAATAVGGISVGEAVLDESATQTKTPPRSTNRKGIKYGRHEVSRILSFIANDDTQLGRLRT